MNLSASSDLRELIDKLMAMRGSPNIHEAAVATAKLQTLLLKHNLSQEDLPSGHHEEYRSFHHNLGDAKDDWKGALLHALARHNLCSTFRNGETAVVTVIGKESNVRVVWWMYDFLQAEIVRLVEAGWEEARITYRFGSRGWKRAFCYGCVETINRRLRDQKATDLRSVDGSSALVIRTDQELSEARDRLFPNVTFRSTRPRTYSWKGDKAGRKAGESVPLDQPLGGERKALGRHDQLRLRLDRKD